MIIKSMSRKTVSFKQLLTYINKENAGQMYDIHQISMVKTKPNSWKSLRAMLNF